MGDLVRELNGKVVASSLDVADRFGKTHKDVLRKVTNIIEDLTAQNCAVRSFFQKSIFINSRNREYKVYEMTRDGFSLVAMSLTGNMALKFKVRFIDAFNKMEAELKRQAHVRSVGSETRKNLTDRIKESGENERMHGHGYSTYTKLAYKLVGIKYVKPKSGSGLRDTLSGEDLERLEIVEDMTKTLVKSGRKYMEVKEILNDIFTPVKRLET